DWAVVPTTARPVGCRRFRCQHRRFEIPRRARGLPASPCGHPARSWCAPQKFGNRLLRTPAKSLPELVKALARVDLVVVDDLAVERSQTAFALGCSVVLPVWSGIAIRGWSRLRVGRPFPRTPGTFPIFNRQTVRRSRNTGVYATFQTVRHVVG